MHHCRQCGASLGLGTREEHCLSCAVLELLAEKTAAPAGPGTLPRIGDYEILEEIARGGMGTVFRARQVSLDRVVALKTIRDGAWASLMVRQRFFAEARAAARLRHPHIVTVHEVGEHDGLPFFSMALVEGPNLAQFIDQRPLSPDSAADLLIAVAEAVHFAHGQGILHRDLKPENILLDATGRPYVTDFGLAYELGGDKNLTMTGEVLGSPAFMSPEQMAGQHDRLGPASDVYALGGLLYFLLTARVPFEAPTLAELASRVAGDTPRPPQQINRLVPPDLETICLKCLHKDPSDRYPSAADLASDLSRFRRGDPVLARPMSGAQRGWRWCRRRPAFAALGAFAAVMLLAAVTEGVVALRRTTEMRQVALQHRAARAERALVEARHLRESGRVGQRSLALAQIREGRRLNDNPEFLARLRDEAAACLVVPDVSFVPVVWFGATHHEVRRAGTLAFSPDLGVCAGQEGGAIVVRRAVDGVELGHVPDSPDSRARIRAVSNSGRWLALDDAGKGGAALWDLKREPPAPAARMAEGCAGFAGFLSAEEFPAFAGVNGSLSIFDLESGRQHELGFMSWVLRKATSWAPFWRVRHLAVGGEGGLCIMSIQDFTAGERPLLALFDLPGGLLLRRFEMEFHAQEVAFNPGGDLIVAVAGERRTEVLDSCSGRRLIGLDMPCLQAGVGTQDQSLGLFWRSNCLVEARLTGDRYCREWRHTWEAMNYRYAEGFTVGGIDALTFSDDGRFLAATYPPRIGIWDLAANQPIGWYPGARGAKPFFHPALPSLFLIDTQRITKLDFALQSRPYALHLETAKTQLSEEGFGEAAFDARGSILAVARPSAHEVLLLNGTNLQCVGQMGPHTNVFRVALSGDGRWLATAARNGGEIWQWDVEARAVIRRLGGSEYSERDAFAFSPNGQWLVLSTAQGYEVLESRTGKSVATLADRVGRSPLHRTLVFSPDGHWLALLLDESDVGLVDTRDWSVLTALPARTRSAFHTLAFNREGNLLAAGGEGGRVCVWNLHAIESALSTLGLGSGTLPALARDPLPATNSPPRRIHHAGFPFPSFPISYPTNAAGVVLAGEFNLQREFSITENPSGVWQYGTKSELAGPFHRFVIPRRDSRDFEGRGDYQIFSWCDEPGREPAIRYHPGPQMWRYAARDPKTGEVRLWNFSPASVHVVASDGVQYRDSTWTGVRFTAPAPGRYEFLVKAHSQPQFERYRSTTTVELALLRDNVTWRTDTLAPDDQVGFQESAALVSGATVDLLLHTQPNPDAGQAYVGLEIEVYRR